MRQVIADLCDLLDEQKNALGKLLEMSEEERKIIIGGEAGRLEEIVRMELRELSKVNSIEKRRIALNDAISAELGITAKDLNTTAIAERAAPDERARIESLQKELTALIEEHKALNVENRELIKAHMEYSELMLDLMIGSEDPLNNFYGGDGRAAPEKKKTTGFFDGRA